MVFLKDFSLILFSAVFLIIAFPQIEWAPLAFVALVPLLLAIDGKKPWVAFRRAYCCGFLFFAGTLGWFIYVTYPGAALLIAYLSLYFAIFSVATVYFKGLPLVPRIFILSSVWVALEFFRAHLLSGFGWVTLGHSQYKNTLLIQIADITGVYGVSFLVILVNLLVFESIKAIRSGSRNFKELRLAQALVCALLLAVLGYGAFVMSAPRAWNSVKVGVVQPNIPQSIKWEESLQPMIVDKTIRLTKSLAKQKPEIIIWPETSLPGVISDVPYLATKIQQAAEEINIPILYGAISREGKDYYNSAVLVSSDGRLAGRYDKIHLVPFGEYLPLRPILGWISNIVPLEDFTPGKNYTVLEAGCPQKTFGTLICFEDTVSEVRRNFVKAGAKFFVNITNDAWFEDTKAPFLHLQAAIFGCIENKRSLVRSANTGVSAFVDPFGRVISSVANDRGKKSFIPGIAASSLPLSTQLTFYTKFGDFFAFLCFLAILGGICLRKYS